MVRSMHNKSQLETSPQILEPNKVKQHMKVTFKYNEANNIVPFIRSYQFSGS